MRTSPKKSNGHAPYHNRRGCRFFRSLFDGIREGWSCGTGQVMLLSAVILGGVLIGATTIAAVLVIFQIRGSNDAVSSTKAFFAADAALEREIYLNLKGALTEPLTFSDSGVSATSSYKIVPPDEIQIRSQGFAGKAARALETIFGSN